MILHIIDQNLYHLQTKLQVFIFLNNKRLYKNIFSWYSSDVFKNLIYIIIEHIHISCFEKNKGFILI